jgi:hypothetical protein
MSIPEHDNRMQFPPTLIDFDDQVGVTGQLHDTYPAPGQQPRYDWFRMAIIALLSMQSSEDPPTQYRTGTPWFNRTNNTIEVWSGTAWVGIATFIGLETSLSGDVTDLLGWYNSAKVKLTKIQPRITYSGRSSASNVATIPVPTSVQTTITGLESILRPLVYINGALVDPRLCNFNPGCPNSILLSGGVTLDRNDNFTVMIEYFDQFLSEDVIAS